MTLGRELAGRVAIVTGAGGGQGGGFASCLARLGANVVVNDLGADVYGLGSSPEPADAKVREIIAAGGDAIANHDDVADQDGARRLVATALERYGRVDILVNNAGNVGFGAFERLEPEAWERMFRIHVGGAVHVTRAVWPTLVGQGYGRVVMSVSNAVFGTPHMSHLAAAKGALVGLTRALGHEGAPHGIRVNAVMAAQRTRQQDALVEYLKEVDLRFLASPEELRDDPRRDSRIQDPEQEATARREAERQVSAVVAWLVHEACDFTGVVLHAGAGHVARVVLAQTEGYAAPDITLEGLIAHRDEVLDETGQRVPRSSSDALAILRRA